MKCRRLEITAGLLFTAGLAISAAAENASPLGTGLTHYYDFETSTTGTGSFNITGQTWNAAATNLQVNAEITLTSAGNSIGTPNPAKDNFGNAYSGGGTGHAASFTGQKATFLCPEDDDSWTISFWAMRENAEGQPRLLVNGTPLDTYTQSALEAASAANTGFGFYMLDDGKVGVRLSEKTGTSYAVKTIVSQSAFDWKNDQEHWRNIMLVRDGTNLTLYVDGARQGSAEMTQNGIVEIPEGDKDGLYATDPKKKMRRTNALDDIAIWSRALSEEEIKKVAGDGKTHDEKQPLSSLLGETSGTTTGPDEPGPDDPGPDEPGPDDPGPNEPEPPPPAEGNTAIAAGLTHYYDFETATTGNGSFNITGQTWNAAATNLQVNAGITLTSAGNSIGTPNPAKDNFGNAYSGGGSGCAAAFTGQKATRLCPEKDASWTISFWAMRENAADQPRLLVNGTPLTAYKQSDLEATSDVNTGFGFYMLNDGKVGVRLSEKTGGTYAVKTIVSQSVFDWKSDQEHWRNIMLVRDGTALTLYVDGAPQGSAEMTQNGIVEIPEGDKDGLYTTIPNTKMKRTNALDDLAIWDRALSADEIALVSGADRPLSEIISPTPPEPEVPPGNGPNIVVIMADDLGWNHVRAKKTTLWTANESYYTPNIDSLGRAGCSFPYAYMQANCAPTRACILSGQYAPRHGVFNVNGLNRPGGSYTPKFNVQTQHEDLWPDTVTLARAFKANGYATAHIGKYHVGGRAADTTPEKMGFDINIGGNSDGSHNNCCFANNGKFGNLGGGAFNEKYAKPYTQDDIDKYCLNWSIIGQSDDNKRKHVCDAVGDAAVDTIKTLAAGDRPFYLQVHPYAVHGQIKSRPDLKQMAEESAWPQPPPSFVILLDGKPAPKAETNFTPTANYVGFVRGLDITVGRIRKALRDPNGDDNTSDSIETNTVLVFTSDNGGTDTEAPKDDNPNLPLTGKKGEHNEGGLRVPFIVSWPGHIPADTMSRRVIHAVDFYPTWLDFATIHTNQWRPDPEVHPLDGFSFKDECLRPGSTGPRGPVYWFFPGYLDTRSKPLLTGVATHTDGDVYRFTYRYEENDWRLWNLTRDPYEKASGSNLTAEAKATLHTLAENAVHWLWKTNNVNDAVVTPWGQKPPPPRWNPLYPLYPKENGVEQRNIPIPD